MVLTPSMMLPLQTHAPDFQLTEPLTGKEYSLQHLRGKSGTLVMFICNHCPYVLHIIDKLAQVCNEYLTHDIQVIAINANDPIAYPDDAPDKMITFAKRYQFKFPYLFDSTQQTATDYHAACTPDFFLFDAHLQLVYRGQFDEARPGKAVPVSGDSLSAAIDSLLAGKPIDTEQKPSIGCNIKWRK